MNSTPNKVDIEVGETAATQTPVDAPMHKPFDSRGKRVAYTPKPGYQWNPLRKYPRNDKCWCDSGRKFKVCCSPRLVPVVTDAQAKQLNDFMTRYLRGDNVKLQIKRTPAPPDPAGDPNPPATDSGDIL